MQNCKESSRYIVSSTNNGMDGTTVNRNLNNLPTSRITNGVPTDSSEVLSNSISEINPENESYSVIDSSSLLTTYQPLAVVTEEEHQESDDSQTLLSSLVCPLTPIETVANELHDLQAIVPPLSYFENVLREHMTSNSGKLFFAVLFFILYSSSSNREYLL